MQVSQVICSLTEILYSLEAFIMDGTSRHEMTLFEYYSDDFEHFNEHALPIIVHSPTNMVLLNRFEILCSKFKDIVD